MTGAGKALDRGSNAMRDTWTGPRQCTSGPRLASRSKARAPLSDPAAFPAT
jgi:hypothetical protein